MAGHIVDGREAFRLAYDQELLPLRGKNNVRHVLLLATRTRTTQVLEGGAEIRSGLAAKNEPSYPLRPATGVSAPKEVPGARPSLMPTLHVSSLWGVFWKRRDNLRVTQISYTCAGAIGIWASKFGAYPLRLATGSSAPRRRRTALSNVQQLPCKCSLNNGSQTRSENLRYSTLPALAGGGKV